MSPCIGRRRPPYVGVDVASLHQKKEWHLERAFSFECKLQVLRLKSYANFLSIRVY